MKSKNWGDARPENVRKVLKSVHEIMCAAFERSFPGDIFIYHDEVGENPITLFERSHCGAYIIKLTATGLYWSQYAYQFAHEYCHVRTNYAVLNLRTKWFEETVCELASIYALIKMSESWRVKPPYLEWKQYSESLSEYVRSIISSPTHQLPEGVAFGEWFKANLPLLERDQYIRDKNSLIAIRLLPIFDRHPSLWNSMTYWNSWGEDLKNLSIFDCMQAWLELLPQRNKEGGIALINMFSQG